MDYLELDWYGCYRGGWGRGRLSPSSFSHPAKVAYGLSERIYGFAIEQSWLKQGDCVLDPFAGIGGFALSAMRRGINFFGVELEQAFVDMGQGCDCTGISKEDWVHYYGRWEKVRHKDGRHWCPRCLNTARKIDDEQFLPLSKQSQARRARIKGLRQSLGRRAPSRQSVYPPLRFPRSTHSPQLTQGTLFEQVEEATTAYKRNSGKIPYSKPHHYKGNLEVWSELGLTGTGRIVQGDSRRLCEVVAGAMGAMSEGDLAGAIGSPPFTASLSSDDPDKRGGLFRDPKRRSDKTLTAVYGDTDGQLGTMPAGELGGLVSSPPHESSEVLGGNQKEGLRGEGWAGRRSRQRGDYGNSDGQLGSMPAGNVGASVSSPPWENALAQDGRGPNLKIVQEMEAKYARTYQASFPSSAYSASEAQLSNTEGNTFWSAARQIMEQTYQILKPGAVAIWTLKSFVRDKKIVDFPSQWKQLGETCGFETIAWIRAWQVEDQGTQFDLSGEAHKKEVHRISFFRRLHIQKFPHLAIEHEVVLVQRKAP